VCLAHRALAEERRLAVASARELLCERLREAGARPVPSQANFVLVETGGDDGELVEALAREGLHVRGGAEYGLHGFVRITVGPAPLMERVAEALGRTLAR